MSGAQLQCALEGRRGLTQLVAGLQRGAQVGQRYREVGVELEGLAKAGNGFLATAFGLQYGTIAVVGHGSTVRNIGQPGKDLAGGIVTALAQHRVAQVTPSDGVGRLEFAGALESRFCPGRVAADHGQVAERVVRPGGLWVLLQRPLGGGLGGFQPAQPYQYRGQPRLGVAVAAAADGFFEIARCGLQLALFLGQAADQKEPLGIVRLVAAPRFKHLTGSGQVAGLDGHRDHLRRGLGPLWSQLERAPSGCRGFYQLTFGGPGAGQAVVSLGKIGCQAGDALETVRGFFGLAVGHQQAGQVEVCRHHAVISLQGTAEAGLGGGAVGLAQTHDAQFNQRRCIAGIAVEDIL